MCLCAARAEAHASRVTLLRVQIVRALVRAGADVNAETKTGGT